MNYTKPEVAVLGEAVKAIEFTGSKEVGSPVDASLIVRTNPAYDLDE